MPDSTPIRILPKRCYLQLDYSTQRLRTFGSPYDFFGLYKPIKVFCPRELFVNPHDRFWRLVCLFVKRDMAILKLSLSEKC